MMRTHWRDERGQAMVLVALGVIVLLGALALAVEFGYGLTQRRVMQNSSDAAALAVGRYLATNVIESDGQTAFLVSDADACDVARGYVEANDSFAPQGGDRTFTMQFAAADPDSGQPVGWTAVAAAGDCGDAAPTFVAGDTRYVRVFSMITYRSLISAVLGFPETTASASARVKLFGTPVTLAAPVWPMVRHYDKSDFDAAMHCGQSCTPEDIEPTTFWSQSEEDVVYANGFKGMVDFSEHSPRFDPEKVDQLITGFDRTGTAPADLLTDRSGNCPGGWDTLGGESPQNQDKQCSIPNWFYYSFGGTLSLTSQWHGEGNVPEGQEAPAILDDRTATGSVCDPNEKPDLAPSCEDPTIGDWVEVAGGNVGFGESARMIDRIENEGYETALSHVPIDPNKPNGTTYGKALLVLIYLWDCAESYSPSDPDGEQWDLIEGANDCSDVGKNIKPDRVHLFTAAPFTFYEGLVDTSEIRGFWGGLFGSPVDCDIVNELGVPMCEMNPLANSAMLVADDNYDGP